MTRSFVSVILAAWTQNLSLFLNHSTIYLPNVRITRRSKKLLDFLVGFNVTTKNLKIGKISSVNVTIYAAALFFYLLNAWIVLITWINMWYLFVCTHYYKGTQHHRSKSWTELNKAVRKYYKIIFSDNVTILLSFLTHFGFESVFPHKHS